MGLQWCDIAENKVAIKRSVNIHGKLTDGKNERARRNFKLTPLAKRILEEQDIKMKEKGIISDYVFPNPDGKSIRYINFYRAWERYKEYNGISDIDLYELRHTFVSLAKRLPPSALKSIVGHSKDMDTLGVYGHGIEGEDDETVKMLETALGKYIKIDKYFFCLQVGYKVGYCK